MSEEDGVRMNLKLLCALPSPELGLCILVGMLTVLPSSAGVEWETQELKFESPVGAAAVGFTFAFTNKGNLPVEFDTPSASCGCTLAKFEKIIYASGESGVLKGTYSASGRRGLNTVTIMVKGNEIDGEVRRPFAEALKLIVTVPEVVKITPGIVLWKKDAERVTKTIRFEINEALSLPLALASINPETFSGEWTTLAEGKVYELKVTPTSTAEAARAMVTVEGVNDDGKTLRFYAHLMIR